MQYRRLGSSGLQLSALSFGAWATFGGRVARSEARNLVAAAWDHGVNFFDNAETYANGVAERMMGDVIADLRLPRDGFAVSSKVFFGAVDDPRPTQRGLSRKHLRDACDAALKRLRVDYLDLYYCHRPDPDTPVAETVAAMDTLVRQGKVLYWGTSEWPAEQIREAHEAARAGGFQAPTMEQPQSKLLHPDRGDAGGAARKRLGGDYLDLCCGHRPDPDTAVAETVAAMDTLVRQGKGLYWGTSEWPAEQIREAHEAARAGGFQAPTMEQPQYNLLHRERVEAEYAPLYADFGMGTTTWSPLASGLLTGKYNDGVPDDSRMASEDYARLQRSEEHTSEIQPLMRIS